ncbi:MAG: hemerythrin domain-containing protein [Deltaproteobacteria bacterium]
MLPIGVLMIEHRLIERMIWLMQTEYNKIRGKGVPDQKFLESAIDFMRNYADRCHHGKEEDVLFRELKSKPLSPEHQKTMQELIGDHVHMRELLDGLDRARREFCGGDYGVILEIGGKLGVLVDLYPCHIEKEDKHFFLPSMEYFTEEEKAGMLRAFDEFDKNLFKEKYARVVEGQEVALK